MKARKTTYSSPKLEIVPFGEEDILTVSTYGNNEGDKPGEGNGTVIDTGSLDWNDP